MYGFDIEIVKENDFEKLFLVNDEYVSVDIFGSEIDYCVVKYNDDNKLEYDSELNNNWNEKECNFIREFIKRNYLK